MSFKWNENFVLTFLSVYQKYPCLWNPHYVKYYDCLAKNEALQNIVKELNIPELNISDCLEQIKVIRERYRQEQIRVIKRLQSGKPYKSPFAWFPVIASMLTKVIDDEDRLRNRMGSVETISLLKDCITIPYNKYDQNISNFPCVQGTRQDYKTKPRKNTKFTKTGNLDILDRKSKRQNDAQLLYCPSCGWEDKKPDGLDISARKVYEQIKPLDIAIPSLEYLTDKLYEYKAHHHRIANKYQGKYNNIIPCPSFPSKLSNYTGYPVDILTTRTYYPQSTRSYVNQRTTSGANATIKPKFCTRETQLSSEQLFPERRMKQVRTSIEQYDKGIQNRVCASKTETDVRKCYREVQNKYLTTQEELKQVAVNTMEQHDEKIRNTICASLSNCQASQKYSSTRERKQIDANTAKYPANDMRNMIGIKLKTVEGSMPNFILITNDGNYLPLMQRDLKELTTDKCQKDAGDHDQKEVEKTRLDDKKFIENEVCIKETCSSDIMEIIKYNSVVTQALLQCLEKVMQEKTKICSVTSLLSKRDNANSDSSKVTVCEQNPCKLAIGNAYSGTSSAVELEIPCCLEKTEKDNAVATFTETFLELNKKHALLLNRHFINNELQDGYVRKEDAIDTFIVLSQIKECADEILKICTLVDYSKRLLLNQFYSRTKSKSKCSSKRNSAVNSSHCQTQDTKDVVDQFTTPCTNSKDVEILYGPSTSKIRDHSVSENGITYAKTMEKPFVKDKDITARAENRDIGLNVSLPQKSFRDSETQYISKKLQDVGVVTDRSLEEKISVATQNREPILIRVIKSNNSEGILKLDKETCVRDAHVLRMMSVDKCSKNMYQKYSVKEYYDELLHPGISHIREREVNCIHYGTSLLSNGIYRYDKRCKSLLPRNHDWIKANIPNFGLSSNQRVSRIPLYARSRKYTRRRTDLYRMSQSYV